MDSSKQKWTLVASITHLRELIIQGTETFSILLAGGTLSSTKIISLDRNGHFKIHNHIDGTGQLLTEAQLYTLSNLGDAIDKKSLFAKIEDD